MILPYGSVGGFDFVIDFFLVVNIVDEVANRWCDIKRYAAQYSKL